MYLIADASNARRLLARQCLHELPGGDEILKLKPSAACRPKVAGARLGLREDLFRDELSVAFNRRHYELEVAFHVLLEQRKCVATVSYHCDGSLVEDPI